jgi:uncharacterized protein YggE
MLRLVAGLFCAFILLTPLYAAERLITVVGEGTVDVVPDMAAIRVGVTSQGKTAREASDATSKQMTALIAALKDAGIGERDMQTARLSLQPQYEPNRSSGGGSRIIAFQANNELSIKIRAIANVPGILDRAIGAGANEMSGIEFVVSKRDELLDKAREDAIADARRKAELYARAAGAKIGQPVSISEEGAAPPPFPMQALRAGAAVPVVPGEQKLRAVVTVSYELTP